MIIIWLLPAAFLGGWLYGRYTAKSPDLSARDALRPAYLKGLNYVLNEQPDKAIEVFIELLQVDSETIETHLALGSLFRRRGEVDRAIRIHQNLIARPNLPQQQSALALLELGVDYMKSGLFDRAETLFKQLVASGMYLDNAYARLLDIYQREQDWEKAIDTARYLEASSKQSLSESIAQFHCELVCELRHKGQLREARKLLKKALSIDRKCVRANLIKADLDLQAGELKAAVKACQHIERQDPEYIPEAVGVMHECYKKMSRLDEFREHLHKIVDNHGYVTPLLILTELIANQRGAEEAARFITARLKKKPSVRGVEKLIEYTLIDAQDKSRDDLNTLKELLGKLLEDWPIYRCRHCGFSARSLHWQCPSCRKWNVVRPIHGIEGE